MNNVELNTILKRMSSFFLLCGIMAIFYACHSLPKEHEIITAANNEIRVPINKVNDGKVHFFTYKKSGKRINFFIRTDGESKLSANFDACFTCYKHKKGYRIEGTNLICNECGMKFRLADEKWDISTGCSPILLKSVVDKGDLVIQTEDIEKGGRLF